MLHERYFNVECFCRLVNDEKVAAKLSERDIPVVVELLADKERVIRSGAVGVLLQFGKASIPALETHLTKPLSEEEKRLITDTLADIKRDELVRSRHTPTAHPK